MFVQVIQGKVKDVEGIRSHLDRWVADLAPDSVGWLGTTAGVTDDGTFVAVARFESAAAADKNSSRPEQGDWWSEVATAFDGEPTFHDSSAVDVRTPGDPSRSRFVQVMRGRVADPERVAALMADTSADVLAARPDILGTLYAAHDGGEWTMCVWFTDEATAREGEQRAMPEHVTEAMAELDALEVGAPTYLDLRDPWMSGPG